MYGCHSLETSSQSRGCGEAACSRPRPWLCHWPRATTSCCKAMVLCIFMVSLADRDAGKDVPTKPLWWVEPLPCHRSLSCCRPPLTPCSSLRQPIHQAQVKSVDHEGVAESSIEVWRTYVDLPLSLSCPAPAIGETLG